MVTQSVRLTPGDEAWRAWLDRTVASAREKGYVETIFGRRRYIPELKDRNFNIRAFGERTATNSPLQGSAADLIIGVDYEFLDDLTGDPRFHSLVARHGVPPEQARNLVRALLDVFRRNRAVAFDFFQEFTERKLYGMPSERLSASASAWAPQGPR